jgi:hypothetical protein
MDELEKTAYYFLTWYMLNYGIPFKKDKKLYRETIKGKLRFNNIRTITIDKVYEQLSKRNRFYFAKHRAKSFIDLSYYCENDYQNFIYTFSPSKV